MKIGLALGGGDGDTLESLVEKIVQTEKAGFSSAWVANIFSLDALTVLAMAGPRTSRIELGTAVVPTYPRHPHAIAQQAATCSATFSPAAWMRSQTSRKPSIARGKLFCASDWRPVSSSV